MVRKRQRYQQQCPPAPTGAPKTDPKAAMKRLAPKVQFARAQKRSLCSLISSPPPSVIFAPREAAAREADRLRKQKQRRLDKFGLITLEIEEDHDDLCEALRVYCAGEVDCEGDAVLMKAVKAIRTEAPGWQDDRKTIISPLVSRLIVRGWINFALKRSRP